MAAVVSGGARYEALLEAAAVPTRVSSFTHSFYRYPARFGERFVREAIRSFSRKGDVVLDPFCGGGTTIVEAMSLGRQAVGCDINTLGLLVASVKTTPLSERELDVLARWLDKLATCAVAPLLAANPASSDALLIGVPPHYRNLLANLVASLTKLPRGNVRDFARVLVLKTAQWALDGKEVLPRPTQFLARLETNFEEMKLALARFSESLVESKSEKTRDIGRRLINCSASEIHSQAFFEDRTSAKLVVTSPPYLGVHVLYNKWQVQGRAETRAPYFIAGVPDLGSPARYTLVPRHASSEEAYGRYFHAIHDSFKAVSQRLSAHSTVIQLVSFANTEAALPRYLEALRSASLELCDVYVSAVGGLSWRRVPSRRWYTRVGATADSDAAHEVLLVHRKRG